MSGKKYYTGIDCFRFIAALLIITIHTSPLTSFSEMGDFILTRVMARVAVPFFFMASGFFTISRYTCNARRLADFIKRTAVIYGAAILLYIPVNIYNGYFGMKNLAPNIIKDMVFDGTFYHLWYLPASMIGAGIAWYMVKMLDYKKAFAAAALLYLIGLFGDSYYGISENISVLNGFYYLVFQVSDHTRNGIFFAPVFFIMGGFAADNYHKIKLRESICGFGISFVLMFGEGILLHYLDMQRHDSMYTFLLPCIYFLFSILLNFKGKRLHWLRTSSLIIYIIHPMMIVVTRLFAKLFHLQWLLIENSLVHYFVVCLTSVIFSASVMVLWNRYRLPKAKQASGTDRAYMEINLTNLEHNARVLKKAMPPKCRLMAVVKADAYGHGAFLAAAHLNKIGVRDFAVATIDEGIKLRKCGIRGDILILGYTSTNRALELKKYDLTQTLIDFQYANALNKQGVAVKTHIKIDTGMHRLGVSDKNISKVKSIFKMKNIKVCGIFTHLCCADSLRPDDAAFTKEQIDRFSTLIEALKEKGIPIPKLHIQSSYGLLNYPYLKCDYVRAGIALYGIPSSLKEETLLKLDLRPVLTLKSKVVLVRTIKEGDTVGYGRCFKAERDSRIAVLCIGYGDGYPRGLSCSVGRVQIHQYIVPVIGRICMDQLVIDITDTEDIAVGDTAILIGGEEDNEVSAPSVAGRSGSISNELLCRMGARLAVVEKY